MHGAKHYRYIARMDVAEHIDQLAADGPLLAAAADAAGLDARVPSCPDWVVRDLVKHQGGVHRWATGIVTGPRAQAWRVDLDEVVGTWPADDDLLDWFADGHAGLVRALSDASQDLDCWTFLAAPSPLAMWARRQAHETAVHRVDAELAAAGPVTPFPPAFAADGIDELLACFITRPGRGLRADPARSLRVRCDDAPGDWLVGIGPAGTTTTTSGGYADCLVSGQAEDLYLALWNRWPPDGLVIDGDPAILEFFRDKVRVRWS
jgi:uncharacterized protein (TIGR03083 family)